ncbi:hypothetical protein EP7_003011 [Isosphaeraceae bacterium EP7]
MACILGVAFATADDADEIDADAPPGVTLRDGFEGDEIAWTQETSDASIALQAHERTGRAAHDGKSSERITFNAGLGSNFYFSYPLPHALIGPKLGVQLYVRASKPGTRLLAKVILPKDLDEEGRPYFIMVPGTIYENTDRWQRLVIENFPDEVRRQVQIRRTATHRTVPLEGAYLEALILNVYSGQGQTDVFLDELSVSPVPEGATPAPTRPARTPEAAAAGDVADEDVPAGVSMVRNRLSRDGQPYFFTAIDAPGADIEALRRAGFDAIRVPVDAPKELIDKAVAKGLKIIPKLSVGSGDAQPTADELVAAAKGFSAPGEVLAWHLGDELGAARDPETRRAELDRIRDAVTGLRNTDLPVTLATGHVADEYASYTMPPKGLDLLGDRYPDWGSSLEIFWAQRAMASRRALTALNNAEALFYADIPLSGSKDVRSAVWGGDVPPGWGEPRVQHDQVRLAAFAALMSGYRGLVFRGDADLTREQGRMMLYELALLNEELDLFESILADRAGPIDILDAYPPEPSLLPPVGVITTTNSVRKQDEAKPLPTTKAARLRTKDRKGSLLLVADFAAGSQFQPSQMAINDMTITVVAPISSQAFEISPGEVKVLDREQVPGGIRITLPEFSGTATILVTTDQSMPGRLAAAIEQVRPMAVQMAIAQAQDHREWVVEVQGRLADDGHTIEGANQLISDADEHIRAAREAMEREDYALAWGEARRVGRYLRHLMRLQFDSAFTAMNKALSPPPDPSDTQRKKTRNPPPKPRRPPGPLLSPVASAPLLSFNLLSQNWLWLDKMDEPNYGPDQLQDGTFEDAAAFKASWLQAGKNYEDVEPSVRLIPAGTGREGNALALRVMPATGISGDMLSPTMEFPAAAVRSPSIEMKAGELARISVWVKMPRMVTPGAGGLFIRDSLGGETLQFRTTDAVTEWREVPIYRRAPADGPLYVTLGLIGFGEVFFDDLTIRRFEGPGAGQATPIARAPGIQPR